MKGGLLLDTWKRSPRRRAGAGRRPRRPRGQPAGPGIFGTRTRTSVMPPKHRLPDEVVADLSSGCGPGAADPRDGKSVARSDVDIEKGRQFWGVPAAQGGDPSDGAGRGVAAVGRRPVPGWRRWRAGRPVGDAGRAAMLRRCQLRPDRAAADAGRGRGVSGRRVARARWRRWSTGCWRRRRSVCVGAGIGSTSPGPDAESSWQAGGNFNHPHAWRYRDYVVDSFNADKPFNVSRWSRLPVT